MVCEALVEGKSHRVICSETNVPIYTISDISKGKSYDWIYSKYGGVK